jgi:hypothetical protein
MRKARLFIFLTLIALFILTPMIKPAQKVKAGFYVEYYTIKYNCVISPPCWGCVEGEWTRDCFGHMTGWGWEPGHNCTYTEVTFGEECILE